MLLTRILQANALRTLTSHRCVSTLPSNRHIKVFPNASLNNSHILSYLNNPHPRLAIGTTEEVPPTPQSFSENPEFVSILNEVLAKHAAQDPHLLSQAQAYATPGGATFGVGGGFFPQQRRRESRGTAAEKGAGAGGGGGASAQGGAGGAGVGGHIHLSDMRNPPDFGRIAWPEDIMGSIEVDSNGNIVGEFQPSGTYRIVTREGILGLSDFMTTKLVERLTEEERNS